MLLNSSMILYKIEKNYGPGAEGQNFDFVAPPNKLEKNFFRKNIVAVSSFLKLVTVYSFMPRHEKN